MQCELEIFHQPQPLQHAIDGFERDAPGTDLGAQLNQWLDLQLEDLKPGHAVAVMARCKLFQLAGIKEGLDNPIFIGQITGQVLGIMVDRELQLLTGAEGQGHGLRAGAA